MVAFWYSLGIVKPSIIEWVNFPSISSNLNLFQVRKVDFPRVKVGKIYLRTISNNIADEKWEIIYPKNEFEIFILPNLFPDLSKSRTIQVLRDSRSLTLSYNFSLEILAYSEPVNANVSNEVTAQLSSFDQSIQELSDRIDSLPNKLLQTNAQIENTNQNEAQLLAVLLGILS
jgi:hypothetical protein